MKTVPPKRLLTLFLFLIAFPASLSANSTATDLDEVLWWLPERSESLMAAHAMFTAPDFDSPSANNLQGMLQAFAIGPISYLRQRLEQDDWTFYVTAPRANVLLVTTDKASLTEVLERMRTRARKRAFEESLPEWKYIDRKCIVLGPEALSAGDGVQGPLFSPLVYPGRCRQSRPKGSRLCILFPPRGIERRPNDVSVHEREKR